MSHSIEDAVSRGLALLAGQQPSLSEQLADLDMEISRHRRRNDRLDGEELSDAFWDLVVPALCRLINESPDEAIARTTRDGLAVSCDEGETRKRNALYCLGTLLVIPSRYVAAVTQAVAECIETEASPVSPLARSGRSILHPFIAEIVLEHIRQSASVAPDKITMNSPLSDIGLNAAEQVKLAASLEERFGGRFPESPWPGPATCESVVCAVDAHLRLVPFLCPSRPSSDFALLRNTASPSIEDAVATARELLGSAELKPLSERLEDLGTAVLRTYLRNLRGREPVTTGFSDEFLDLVVPALCRLIATPPSDPRFLSLPDSTLEVFCKGPDADENARQREAALTCLGILSRVPHRHADRIKQTIMQFLHDDVLPDPDRVRAARAVLRPYVEQIVIVQIHRLAATGGRDLELGCDLQDLGVDSLKRTELVASLEREFGGRFPADIEDRIEDGDSLVSAVLAYLGLAPFEASRTNSFHDVV